MALFWTCFSILAFSCIALIIAINVNYVGNNKYLKEYSRQIFELQDKNEKLRKRIRNLEGGRLSSLLHLHNQILPMESILRCSKIGTCTYENLSKM